MMIAGDSITPKPRIALLAADHDGPRDLRILLEKIAEALPSASVRIERIGAAALAAHGTALPLRAIETAAAADAVFVLAKDVGDATAAALIGLREELGFTRRLHEPEFARMWLTERGSRGCYVVGRLPSGLVALALALEFSFGDRAAGERVRGDLQSGEIAHIGEVTAA